MFSLQPGDELVFRASTAISESDKIPHDLISDHAFVESNIINFASSTSSTSSNSNKQLLGPTQIGFRQSQTRNRDVHSTRRILHRDIERKRRQEMSNHYASLRDLLPPELIKGKRSICDHMQEAVTYIKHKEKNIQELLIRKDKLVKKFCNLSGSKIGCSDGGENLPNFVIVNQGLNEVEILLSCSLPRTDFGLSRVLAELLERELNVVSYVSTRKKGRFLHKIQAQAGDLKSLDLVVLQERLRQLIN